MLRFGPDKGDIDMDQLKEEILRLESLLADMWALSSHGAPDYLTLAHAPFLDDWRVMARTVPCLVGRSTGHPELPGIQRAIVTSDIELISESNCVARTRSRWYRLGNRSKNAGH